MTRLDDDRELYRALRAWVQACGGDPDRAEAAVVVAEVNAGEKLEDFARRWATSNGYVKT